MAVVRFCIAALLLIATTAVDGAVPYLTGSPNTGNFQYSGYMSDLLCVNNRIAVDGADMLLAPQNHSLHCLVDIAACYDSGYCLQQQDPVTNTWHCAYNFTSAQTMAIRAKLMENRVERRNLHVIFFASWDNNSQMAMNMQTLRYVTPTSTTSGAQHQSSMLAGALALVASVLTAALF